MILGLIDDRGERVAHINAVYTTSATRVYCGITKKYIKVYIIKTPPVRICNIPNDDDNNNTLRRGVIITAHTGRTDGRVDCVRACVNGTEKKIAKKIKIIKRRRLRRQKSECDGHGPRERGKKSITFQATPPVLRPSANPVGRAINVRRPGGSGSGRRRRRH